MPVAQPSLAVIKLKEENLKSMKLCLRFCVTLKSSEATAKRNKLKAALLLFLGGGGEGLLSSTAAKKVDTNSVF